MDTKISDCQTIAELNALEKMYVLSEAEQRLVYAKKVEIISRLLEWGIENERQGLTANLSDSWTPEQRQHFMFDWNNDEPLQQMISLNNGHLKREKVFCLTGTTMNHCFKWVGARKDRSRTMALRRARLKTTLL
jgi:hypothetical protein